MQNSIFILVTILTFIVGWMLNHNLWESAPYTRLPIQSSYHLVTCNNQAYQISIPHGMEIHSYTAGFCRDIVKQEVAHW